MSEPIEVTPVKFAHQRPDRDQRPTYGDSPKDSATEPVGEQTQEVTPAADLTSEPPNQEPPSPGEQALLNEQAAQGEQLLIPPTPPEVASSSASVASQTPELPPTLNPWDDPTLASTPNPEPSKENPAQVVAPSETSSPARKSVSKKG